jgi:hypothetical protein
MSPRSAVRLGGGSSGARTIKVLLPCALIMGLGLGLQATAQSLDSTAGHSAMPSTNKSAVRKAGGFSVAHAGASPAVQAVVQAALRSGDHQNLPFVVVDKIHAQVLVFSGTGRWLGTASALIGLARGDEAAPGLGERPLSQIQPHERVTPAGRFVAELDRNAAGQTILWVDYEQAISLHPVRSLNPQERRLERLSSASLQDKRISYGCINVPTQFWHAVVLPAFRHTKGIVYVLPDSRPLHSVFKDLLPSIEKAVAK